MNPELYNLMSTDFSDPANSDKFRAVLNYDASEILAMAEALVVGVDVELKKIKRRSAVRVEPVQEQKPEPTPVPQPFTPGVAAVDDFIEFLD